MIAALGVDPAGDHRVGEDDGGEAGGFVQAVRPSSGWPGQQKVDLAAGRQIPLCAEKTWRTHAGALMTHRPLGERTGPPPNRIIAPGCKKAYNQDKSFLRHT